MSMKAEARDSSSDPNDFDQITGGTKGSLKTADVVFSSGTKVHKIPDETPEDRENRKREEEKSEMLARVENILDQYRKEFAIQKGGVTIPFSLESFLSVAELTLPVGTTQNDINGLKLVFAANLRDNPALRMKKGELQLQIDKGKPTTREAANMQEQFALSRSVVFDHLSKYYADFFDNTEFDLHRVSMRDRISILSLVHLGQNHSSSNSN